MSSVNSVSNYLASTASNSSASDTTPNPASVLNQTDFLKLLVAQMQYQDPMNPQSDTDMAAQMAQFTSLQQATRVIVVAGDDAGEQSGGQHGDGAGGFADTPRRVSCQGVVFNNGTPQIMVNGRTYNLSQVIGGTRQPCQRHHDQFKLANHTITQPRKIMLLSLDSAVSALEQFQQQLNVIGNNIANVNTVGFKSADVNFADTLSQTLGIQRRRFRAGRHRRDDRRHHQQFHAGFHHQHRRARRIWRSTATAFSWSKIRPPARNMSRATANFTVDANGYLVTSNGMRVQGYSDAGLTTMGDIKIDNTGATTTTGGATCRTHPPCRATRFSSDGTASRVTLADGTQFTRGQILLQNFANPNQLVKAGNNLYSGLAAAGPLATPRRARPATAWAASSPARWKCPTWTWPGSSPSLITTQSAYEANSKVITTSDNILQTLVNLVR